MKAVRLSLLMMLVVMCSCVEQTTKPRGVVKVKSAEVLPMGTGESKISYPGKVTPQKGVNLSFRVAGVIESVIAIEGNFIRKGDVVALMDDRDYKLQLLATQAEYDAINGEMQRLIALYEDQSLSQNDYEKAQSAIRQITSKLDAHRNAYEDTRLRAPFDGYVQRVNFDSGEAVAAGTPIVKFISATSPEIVVNIPAVEYLRRGDLLSATAVVSSYAGVEFPLERIALSHLSNLNQLYECRFRVGSVDGQYPPLGLSALVTLNYSGEGNQPLKIPFSAVVQRNSQSYIWAIEEGKANLKSVDVVTINGDGTALVKGEIAAGDIVISAGVNSIEQGQSVEPLAEPSKSNIGNIL